MRRLALICQHFYPEMISTGMHMTELAAGLSRQGWPLRVYCAQPVYKDETQDAGAIPRLMEYEGIEIVRVPAWGSQRASLAQRALNGFSYLLGTAWYLIRDRKQLRGIINTTNPPFLGLAAIMGQIFGKLSFVTIVYDIFPGVAICVGAFARESLIVRIWEGITRLILNRSAGLVVIGRDMERLVKHKLQDPDSNDVMLIPNWSDAERIHPVPPDQNDFVRQHNLQNSFVVQYSGRMGRTHNIEPLLEAAKLLAGQPIVFQLIGDGAKRPHLEALAQELALTNVQFLPYQPFEDLANVLSAPDLAVVCLDKGCTGFSVPSKTYGIMASGTPILAFLEPDSEIGLTVQDQDCGIILPDPTGEQVAKVIKTLMEDPQRRAQMGTNGRQSFLRNYTLAMAVERYGEFLSRHFGSPL